MTNKLEILDGMCGTGKTEGIFKWMNNQLDTRFLYVTPFIKEVEERAVNSLGELDIQYPVENKNSKLTKTDSLLLLLKSGANIAFTHSLFKLMTREHIKLIKEKEYTVIIDEECDLIEPLDDNFFDSDIKFLIDKKSIEIDTNDLGKITWVGGQYDNEFRYAKFRNMANLGMLYAAKSKNSCMTVHLPITLVESAKRVILISYRFEHSIMNHFVQMKGLEVVPFTEVTLSTFDKSKLKDLIDVLDFTHSEHFKDSAVLSLNWYDKSNQEKIDLISKVIYNICRNNKAKKEDVMWTSPAKYAINVSRNGKKINPKGYSAEDDKDNLGCFVACSSKATNDYANKWMLVHAFNRYPNQTLLIYLRDYGFLINRDEFALSEMIQWIWRSRIRNGEPIKLCLIPKRMKSIFVTWLDES